MTLAERFEELRAQGRAAFCPFFTVGYPTVRASIRLAAEASAGGADVIEVGVPFSDPLADGPTIQAASQRALEGGVRLSDAFSVTRAIREGGGALPVLMTYFNPIHYIGIERFVDEAAGAGAAGLIVPDLPHEEAGSLRAAAAKRGIDLIALVAPTTPKARIGEIAGHATGFLYLVAVTGVTGARSRVDAGLERFVTRVRQETDLPLCIGFGISTPEQARAVARIADGFIVGSALVDSIERSWEEGEDACVEALSKRLEAYLGATRR